MKTALKILASLLVGVMVFFLIYLMGAFYSCSWNQCNWSDVCRETIAVMGGTFSIIGVGVTLLRFFAEDW